MNDCIDLKETFPGYRLGWGHGVVDYAGKLVDMEAGLGFGLTRGSDNVTFKVILSRDLNKKK